MPKETPASAPEYQMRVDEIKGLIIKGMTQAEIVRYGLEKHAEDWALSDRQIRNMVYDAKTQLSEEAPGIDRRREFAIAKARNDLLFNSSFKIQDFKTALSANVQNIKLMRLDDPKFKMDWKAAAEAAGLDPEETMQQFTALMNAQAESAQVIEDQIEYDDESDYGND